MKKKKLITHLSYDITGMRDRQIEALKAMLAASFDEHFGISFEITEVDEKTSLERLLQSVRLEFSEKDTAETTKPSMSLAPDHSSLDFQSEESSDPPQD